MNARRGRTMSRPERGGPDDAPPATAAAGDHPVAVVAVKTVHTLAWFSIETSMLYLLYAGLTKRSDRSVAVAAGLVAGETAVFAGNGFRCPLTQVAERLGSDRGGVTDIYLPRWFAHNLPVIHVPLMAMAIYLHRDNLLRLRPTRPGHGAASGVRPRTWQRRSPG